MATRSSLMSLFEPIKTRENLSSDALLDMSMTNRYRSDPKSDQSLQLCTEGLGSESSDDMDDMMEEWRGWGIGRRQPDVLHGGTPPKSSSLKEFPPPISSIGKRVCLRSYRENGRFVLREMRIPSKEILHASREDGRLKLHFVRPVEVERGDDEEEEEEEQEVGGIGQETMYV